MSLNMAKNYKINNLKFALLQSKEGLEIIGGKQSKRIHLEFKCKYLSVSVLQRHAYIVATPELGCEAAVI
jgi:hypothetical protein